MDNFTIRTANENDCELILQFINELARYEKMENDVSATPESLKEWLFQKRTAEAIFPLENGKEIGFALYFHNFSTFVGKGGLYLEDIFILPEYRGKGYGKAVFRYLIQKAKELDCGRIEWCCLDWNKPSIEFYKSLGAKPLDEWTIYRLSQDKLTEF